METTMLEYVLARLDDYDGELKDIAKDSGVPYTSLHRIAKRYTPNPRVGHVQALYNYFQHHEIRAEG